MNTSGQKQKIIFVLGLPRSGSSALMEVLTGLGISLGDTDQLKKGDVHNPRGYFELNSVLEINETIIHESLPNTLSQLFQQIGMTNEEIDSATKDWGWTSCRGPVSPSKSFSENALDPIKKIQNMFSSIKAPIAIKDARFSFTLPVWQKYFEPVCILLWRDPVEFGDSLNKTSLIPHKFSFRLWSICLRSALQVAQGLPCLIMNHHELLQNAEASAQKIDTFLNNEGIKTNHDIQKSSQVIEKNFYRSKKVNPDLIEARDFDQDLLKWLTANERGRILPENKSPVPDEIELLTLIGTTQYYFLHLKNLKTHVEYMKNRIENMGIKARIFAKVNKIYSNFKNRFNFFCKN